MGHSRLSSFKCLMLEEIIGKMQVCSDINMSSQIRFTLNIILHSTQIKNVNKVYLTHFNGMLLIFT